MGCGCSYVCLDCKQLYYVGYESYGSWIWADTLTEFDARARKVMGADTEDPWTTEGNLRKNQNIRRVLAAHEGHRLQHWHDDYEYGVEHGTLWGMGSYGTRGAPILEHIDEFEQVNLWDTPAPAGDAREGSA